MPTDAERWRFLADNQLTLHTDGGDYGYMIHWLRTAGPGEPPKFYPVSNGKTADQAIDTAIARWEAKHKRGFHLPEPLTPAQREERAKAILAFLKQSRGSSAAEIAEALSLELAETWEALQSLEAQGRVERTVGLTPDNQGVTFRLPD